MYVQMGLGNWQSNPGIKTNHHRVKLGGFVGYLKRHKELVKLSYRKPRDLRVLSNVDRKNATMRLMTRRLAETC